MLGTLNGGDRYTQKVTYLIAEHPKGDLPKIEAIECNCCFSLH